MDSGSPFWRIQLDQDLVDTISAIYPEWFKVISFTYIPKTQFQNHSLNYPLSFTTNLLLSFATTSPQDYFNSRASTAGQPSTSASLHSSSSSNSSSSGSSSSASSAGSSSSSSSSSLGNAVASESRQAQVATAAVASRSSKPPPKAESKIKSKLKRIEGLIKGRKDKREINEDRWDMMIWWCWAFRHVFDRIDCVVE